jgi:acetolactate synthase-1/2/3 large subunit
VFNAATPLATSFTDSIPVLLLSGQVPRGGQGLRSGYYHENDQFAACDTITKARFRVEEPGEVVATLDRAWIASTSGRPGPVLLEIPIDVQRMATPTQPWPSLPMAPSPAAPSTAEIRSLAQRIERWQRPLLLAGGGVVSAGAESLLARLAERLGAPVFSTANGKGAFPGRHPLARGMPWVRGTSDLTQMDEFLSPLFRQADGLLALGCRFTQLSTGSWTLKLPPLAQIDIDPTEIGRHYPVEQGIVGDLSLALEALLAELPGRSRTPWNPTRPSEQNPWSLPGFEGVQALRRALPDDGILAADVTRLGYILMTRFPLDRSRCFLHPAGSVAMGYALPAALGAKAAWPQRKILAVVGDGGFLMSALELASAVQENLPVVVLLVNDHCLSLIKSTQQRRYAERYIAVDLRNPDFELLTRSFGADYRRVEGDEELERGLREAFQAERTTVIEIRPGDARR